MAVQLGAKSWDYRDGLHMVLNVLTFGEQRCSPHREGQIRPGLLLQGTLGCTPLPGPRGPQTQGTRWVGTCCWRGTKDRASLSISLTYRNRIAGAESSPRSARDRGQTSKQPALEANLEARLQRRPAAELSCRPGLLQEQPRKAWKREGGREGGRMGPESPALVHVGGAPLRTAARLGGGRETRRAASPGSRGGVGCGGLGWGALLPPPSSLPDSCPALGIHWLPPPRLPNTTPIHFSPPAPPPLT
ncbi:uncharacterized protein LOC112650741 [Canis lupus dingo]|uniref:uncharacterized protein LOC112650741 n=1 Tax=Canis lupus dingo TaxID=286419 RepID=UPI000DC6C5AE|nr:uncharacterized protein LOC112650741 [Canis lupus dingo]